MQLIQTKQNMTDWCLTLQNCYDIVKANRNELTPSEEEATDPEADTASEDQGASNAEEYDIIGSDNKPEQL